MRKKPLRKLKPLKLNQKGNIFSYFTYFFIITQLRAFIEFIITYFYNNILNKKYIFKKFSVQKTFAQKKIQITLNFQSII